MSTTVSYKGETLTTVSNATKTLQTEGKYLEDDITLTDVSGGGATLITKSISANGTYNASSDSADGYSQVNVSVPASAVDTGTKSITANGNGQDVVGYAAVNVNVPNSYSAGDEGKVVSNGALVAQTAHADVTPTTSDQTIDTTLNNSLKVKGDADLVAGNIKKDVEIFGVTGSYEGGGGSGIFADYINGVENIIIEDENVTAVSNSALRRKNNFSVRFPNCTELGTSAFQESFLTSAYLPKVTSAGQSPFRSSRLEYSILPALTSMGNSMHESIGNYLLGADYGASAQSTLTIQNWCFYGCPNCNKIVLRYSDVCPLANTNAFQGSAFANNGSGGTLYVPSALIASYQAASNWSTILGYANNSIVAIESSQYENYYVDGTPIS
ncbi:MAG: leucine-rich repeat protein [Aeriscardovia sp.]|nr:leucine-rich repeat protein [Aeriscardovia sp.]